MKIIKRIFPFTTVILAFIYGFVMFFNGTSDIYQYLILSLLIMIASTSIFMDMEYTSKFEKYYDKIDTLVDKASIQTFETVDKCARELKEIIKTGDHIVDFVSIDTEVRTKNKKNSKKMIATVQHLFKSPNVKLTYITMLREDTAISFLSNLYVGKLHDSNNSYAYFDSDNGIPFATFIIVDNKYVITRSPYEASQDSSYIIVRNEVLAKHYKDWLAFIWRSANKVESKKDIELIQEKAMNLISDDKKDKLTKLIEDIKVKVGE